jgi:hypothetical protein
LRTRSASAGRRDGFRALTTVALILCIDEKRTPPGHRAWGRERRHHLLLCPLRAGIWRQRGQRQSGLKMGNNFRDIGSRTDRFSAVLDRLPVALSQEYAGSATPGLLAVSRSARTRNSVAPARFRRLLLANSVLHQRRRLDGRHGPIYHRIAILSRLNCAAAPHRSVTAPLPPPRPHQRHLVPGPDQAPALLPAGRAWPGRGSSLALPPAQL